jgi:hypothetical protein
VSSALARAGGDELAVRLERERTERLAAVRVEITDHLASASEAGIELAVGGVADERKTLIVGRARGAGDDELAVWLDEDASRVE